MFFLQKPILTSLYTVRQAIFAGIVLLVMLAFYNKVSSHPIFNAIGMTSIASSIFIVFSAPHTLAGQNRAIVGGYIIGIGVGILCHYLLDHYHPMSLQFLQPFWPLIWGGLTITFVLLIMVALQMPHPPAAGLALGIVIDNWEPIALLLIGCIITALAVMKQLLGFKPLIKD